MIHVEKNIIHAAQKHAQFLPETSAHVPSFLCLSSWKQWFFQRGLQLLGQDVHMHFELRRERIRPPIVLLSPSMLSHAISPSAWLTHERGTHASSAWEPLEKLPPRNHLRSTTAYWPYGIESIAQSLRGTLFGEQA